MLVTLKGQSIKEGNQNQAVFSGARVMCLDVSE